MHLPAEIVILHHYVFDSYQKYFLDHKLYQFFDAVIPLKNPAMIIVCAGIAFSRRRVQNLRKTIAITYECGGVIGFDSNFCCALTTL
jgi:hypothetical protein